MLQNRYSIIKELGEGGFGKAFLAEDTQMPSHRKCVIKQLKPISDNPNIYKLIQERFNQEAIILEKLGTENKQIPSLFAYFQEDNLFYLVQEYIEGITLTDLVQQKGILPEAEVRKILLNVLPVFDFIHSERIIHRDIKPDNLILRDKDQLPVLIDFGAVKETMGTIVTTSGTPTSSIIIGSPGFMPSEQSIGRPVYATDIYALGLTAIFLLTGKLPHELTTNQATGEIQWLEFCQTPITADLASILNKAIAPHYKDRYLKAKYMLEALKGQSTITIPPPTTAANPTTNYPPPTTEPNYFQPTTSNYLQETKLSQGPNIITNGQENKIPDNSQGLNKWQKALTIGTIMGLFMMIAVIVSNSLVDFSSLTSKNNSSNNNSRDNSSQGKSQTELNNKSRSSNYDNTNYSDNTNHSNNDYQKLKPPSQNAENLINKSNNDYQELKFSNQDAENLINKWLNYKKEIFGPSHKRYLGSEVLTGKAYNDNISRADGQESSSEWLANNDAYYTYGMQSIDEIRNLTVKGNNAVVDVVVTEQRTLYNRYDRIDPNNSASDQRLVRYYLSLEDGNWKISDYQTLQVMWKNQIN
jgi:serine/threonine-protein kinase